MHPLLQQLYDAHERSRLGQFTYGLSLPFRAAKFLVQNAQLVPFVIIPAMINIVLFGLSAFLLVTNAGDLVEWLWQKPIVDAMIDYLWVGLWYVAYTLAILLAFVLSYVFVLVAGGIVASPFHDLLSEHTERILCGVDELPEDNEPFFPGMLRSIGSSAVIGLLYAVLITPILLLNLIPFAGSAAATVLGSCVSAYFVGLEYSDPTLQRHGVPLRSKLSLIWDNIPLAGGFGLGTSFLLWVPLLNFACMPIAVIAGTALGLVLEDAPP
ncbi:MAG: EI24 domain-containing protein [Persicimonas sp.]